MTRVKTSSPAGSPRRTLADAWAASRARGNNFDAIRLFAASLVIFSHAFEIVDGSRANEPLEVLSGQISLGELAVLIFFAVSGFLIAKSWQAAPKISAFGAKRLLRIMPALIAVVALLTFVVGPLVSTMTPTDYFRESGSWLFLFNTIFIADQTSLPGVFTETPMPLLANAPLWTLAFEASCYAIVAALGVFHVLSLRVCAIIVIGLLFISTFPELRGAGLASEYLFKLALLGPPFFAGVIAVLAADKIPLDAHFAAICALGLIIAMLTNVLTPAFAILGVYLVLFIAFADLGPLKHAGRFGDFSYGLYLWGWPVQQMVQSILAPESWAANFVIAFPLTLLLAVASWRLIEAPALALKKTKRRPVETPSAPLSAEPAR